MSEQTEIDPYRTMNRYPGRKKDWPSETVFEAPRRTLKNGWKKFHATRDCGSEKVMYIEKTGVKPMGENREYELRCWSCGHKISEEEILFIGGDWYSQEGWMEFGRPIEDVWLSPERVVELGPDPDSDELAHALNLTRIEHGVSGFGVTFGNESYSECSNCEKETFLLFDKLCRMCYDGEWTDSMQDTLNAVETSIRERNNSFIHRLEQNIDPYEIKDRAFTEKVLWRRHEFEDVPQLVEVTQCLKDDDDGHWEYILTDMLHGTEWRFHEDDLEDCFWDTGLYNDESSPLENPELRKALQRACNHSFHTVHDDDGNKNSEKCIHCKISKSSVDS